MEEKSEGIVVRSADYKERERIITVFTPNAGLISLIVKYISPRKPNFLSLSTPFCQGEFIFRRGKSELFRFHDGTVLDEMLILRNHLNHLQAAGNMTQSILLSQMPGKAAPQLYALFLAYMKHIPYFEDASILTASFDLKILKYEGLLALTRSCSVCQSLPAQYLWCGECVCASHAPHQAHSLSADELHLLEELLLAKSFERLKDLKIEPGLLAKIRSFFKESL